MWGFRISLETLFDVLSCLTSIGSLLRTKGSRNEMIIDEVSTSLYFLDLFYRRERADGHPSGAEEEEGNLNFACYQERV